MVRGNRGRAQPGDQAVVLGTVLYRAGLVPRILPLLGLIGAPTLFGSKIVVLFGGMDDVDVAALLCALPIEVWEFGLGCWLVARGFSPTAHPLPARPQVSDRRVLA